MTDPKKKGPDLAIMIGARPSAPPKGKGPAFPFKSAPKPSADPAEPDADDLPGAPPGPQAIPLQCPSCGAALKLMPDETGGEELEAESGPGDQGAPGDLGGAPVQGGSYGR